MTRVLLFSTLFPNRGQPNHGVFVENRLRETLALGGLEAAVMAPIPFFPSSSPLFGRYAAFAKAPPQTTRNGVQVWHPRYLAVPGLSRLTPGLLYAAALNALRGLQARGQWFDVIDAHYAYPDGVAAARLGRKLGLPVVITARGSDLTQLAEEPGPRAEIQWAVQEAAAVVGVCEDLRRRLVALGAPEERSLTLRNGVDLQRFSPVEREAARRRLEVEGFTLLSVGALIPRKGHDLTLRALARCPQAQLLIVGAGPLRGELAALASQLGISDRVRFLGDIPHHDLPAIYSAADAMVLASEREGWANVLLESMACGTPVVATDVNGTREVVRSRVAGRLVARRSPDALAAAIQAIQADPPARRETRLYAEQFGWSQVGLANRALLSAVAQAGYSRRRNADTLRDARAVMSEPEERVA